MDLAENGAQQTDLTNQINDFQDTLNAQRQQLINEFSSVNASLEAYPFLLQEITAQLGQQNAPGNNSVSAPVTGTPFSATSTSSAGTQS